MQMGSAVEGDRVDSSVGSTKGSVGGWEVGDLLWQGVARPERCRAGWPDAQGRSLLGWSPELVLRVGRPAVLWFFLALLWWGGRALAVPAPPQSGRRI